MSSLRIYLFGVPRVERDGETISISRRKALALLAYLAVTGQPHSRDALATLLWPEYDQSSARANLRRDLSRLKDAVGEDVLLIDRTQVSLNPEAESWLDVAEFQCRLATAQQHDHSSARLCADCLDALTEAVTLYSEDFMAGFTLSDSPDFDEWQFFQAEGLRQSLAEALQQLIGWDVSQEEYEPAIEYGRRWLALDPLHEPAHRQLMRLYAWFGQQAAALRQYEECVRLLDEELGVEPQAETKALYEAIKTRQLAPPAAGPNLPQAAREASRTYHLDEPGAGSESAEGEMVFLPAEGRLPPETRYVLEELLATGGHGEVYRGRDRVTDQPVVIKRLRPELIRSEPQFVARFVREGEALRQLNHPNIVHMLAAFEQDGQYSIVMEYVPGGTLRQLLEETPQLPSERALDIALELADALARAHHLGVIHRDVKPDNVLLAADGTPRLTDFGIARLRGDGARLTQTGHFIGSPAYMSPEALRGEELNARSDIWSFGVLLYEMLAGRRPFAGEQVTPVLVSILSEPVPKISHLRPDVPPALANLLVQMLVKERDHRILSMRLVAAELEAIRSGRPAGYKMPGRRSPDEEIATPVDRLSSPPEPLTPSMQLPVPQHGLPLIGTLFVGRERECNHLVKLIQVILAGQGRVALVEGEPGVGKSRLVQEILDYAREQGVSALVAKCYEAEQEMLYEVVIELVAQALAGWPASTFARIPPLSLAEIALLVPDVAAVFPNLPAVPAGLAEARQARLFRALAQFLSAPAAPNGLILVVDDIQWADPVTRQFLHYLTHHVAAQPILLILVYRSAEAAADEQLAAMIHTWQRERHVSRLTLKRLSAEDTAALVAALPLPASRAGELAQWLHRESDGNPFFLVSILQSLQEQGLLDEGADQSWLQQAGARLTLPDALRQLVRNRLRRLPAKVQSILDVAAVFGRRLDLQTLQAIADEERLPLLEAVEQLLARQLLREEEDGSTYDFSHDKIREAVYHDLSAARRRLLHQHIAEVVESLDDSRVSTLAEHYERGEVWDKAIIYLARTAARSRQFFAVREALRFYDRALALAAAHPGAVDKAFVADLHEQRGEARAHAGEFEGAAADLQVALAAAVAADDARRMRDLHIKLGMTFRRNDRLDVAIDHLQAALEAARSGGDERNVADALYHLGTAVWSQGDNHQARIYHEEAVAICRRLGLKDLVAVQALHGLGEARWQAGHPTQSLDLSAESLDLARQIGDKSYQAENLTNMALVLQGTFGLADYRRAESLLLEALTISRGAGLEWHRLTALAELGCNHSLLGDYGQALATMQEALDLAESLGSKRLRSYALNVRGVIWQELNQPERAEADHLAGIRIAEDSGNGFWLPRLRADWAIARLLQGDLSVGEGLQAVLKDALAREVQGHAVRCLEGLARWTLAKGEPQQALAYVEQLHDLAQLGGMREVVAQAQRQRGEARLALGEWEAAAADLQQALALAEELGRIRLVWDAHAALARLCRAQEEDEMAASHEAQVQAIVNHIASTLPDSTLQDALLTGK